MKTKFLLLLFLSFSLSIFAQKGKSKRDQVKALKVSFLTTELNLSSDESAKFWPVYNAHEQKEWELKSKMRSVIRKIDEDGIDKLSDKEANSYLAQLQEADDELASLRKKLTTDLKPIIGPVKILKLHKLEHDFNKKLLMKYKNKKR